MSQDPLRPTAIKGVVSKVQAMSSAHVVLHWEIHSCGPGARLHDHGLAVVRANDLTRAADQLCERPCVIPESTADVQQMLAWFHFEQRKGAALQSLNRFHRADSL